MALKPLAELWSAGILAAGLAFLRRQTARAQDLRAWDFLETIA
jgi:hypothetical protein